jgi:hypothetical protein
VKILLNTRLRVLEAQKPVIKKWEQQILTKRAIVDESALIKSESNAQLVGPKLSSREPMHIDVVKKVAALGRRQNARENLQQTRYA